MIQSQKLTQTRKYILYYNMKRKYWPNGKPRPMVHNTINVSLPEAKKKRVAKKITEYKQSHTARLLFKKPNANLHEVRRAILKDKNDERDVTAMKVSIREGRTIIQRLKRDILSTFAEKALECAQNIDPKRISPNAMAVTAGIATQRALEIEASIPEDDSTTEPPLVAFMRENNLTFHDLTQLVRNGSKPEGVSYDQWKALQSLLSPPSNTIDIP